MSFSDKFNKYVTVNEICYSNFLCYRLLTTGRGSIVAQTMWNTPSTSANAHFETNSATVWRSMKP